MKKYAKVAGMIYAFAATHLYIRGKNFSWIWLSAELVDTARFYVTGLIWKACKFSSVFKCSFISNFDTLWWEKCQKELIYHSIL